MLKKLLLIVLIGGFLTLIGADKPQANVIKVERVIQDKETITAEEFCLGLKIIRVDYYTYKDKSNKDLDSCVVWIYQKKDNVLVIQHKFKSIPKEIWDTILDSWDTHAISDTTVRR